MSASDAVDGLSSAPGEIARTGWAVSAAEAVVPVVDGAFVKIAVQARFIEGI